MLTTIKVHDKTGILNINKHHVCVYIFSMIIIITMTLIPYINDISTEYLN